MNNVITFDVAISPQVSGVPQFAVIPLIVPDKLAFRLRYFEVRLNGLVGSDNDIFAALSKGAEEPVKASNALLIGGQYIASVGWTIEVVSTGAAALPMVQRVDLWDMDYRMVMRPTIHFGAVGTGQAMTAVLAGELVGISEGARNGIIAWQGGAKDA